ncbi:MAG: M28 family peptidase, partial [Gemmatimonadales bacterium]
MSTRTSAVLCIAAVLLSAMPVAAQNFPTDDAVIEAIWNEGTENSQAWTIGQAMLDSIGPRLTGTPAVDRANQWAQTVMSGWGLEARVENYGTWKGWERGVTHVDLLEPRVRTLEATLMAWSPGTDGTAEGGVVTFPKAEDAAGFDAWLPSVEGNFVALAMPQHSCRPLASYEEHGTEAQVEAVREKRRAMQVAWGERLDSIGYEPAEMIAAIQDAGALGILWSDWSGGWGSRRVFALNTRFGAATTTIPAVDLSCEDYGLVWRLARKDQGPKLRVVAESTMMDDAPVANVIGEIRGTELPNEYVVLSAHFDSWDGGSGATDNGTGSIVMMEAM